MEYLLNELIIFLRVTRVIIYLSQTLEIILKIILFILFGPLVEYKASLKFFPLVSNKKNYENI